MNAGARHIPLFLGPLKIEIYSTLYYSEISSIMCNHGRSDLTRQSRDGYVVIMSGVRRIEFAGGSQFMTGFSDQNQRGNRRNDQALQF